MQAFINNVQAVLIFMWGFLQSLGIAWIIQSAFYAVLVVSLLSFLFWLFSVLVIGGGRK